MSPAMKSPSKQPLPLNYIRSFESAARNLSFTAAARELGYTQAAISSHIRALEHHIGWKLFVRYPRSLRLTEMGEAFLPTLREALEQIDHATEAIVARARSRTVVISCPVSLAENWLAQVLTDFRRRHRDIEIILQGTVWEDPLEDKADLVISVRRFDDRPSESERLWEDELVLVCAPDLAQGPAPIRTAVDLEEHEWIFVLGRQEYWHAVAEAIGQDEAGHKKRITTNSTNIALELAAQGAGLVVTQRSLAQLYLRRGLLVEPLKLPRPPSPWAYYLSTNPLSRGSHHRILRDWLMARAGMDFPARREEGPPPEGAP